MFIRYPKHMLLMKMNFMTFAKKAEYPYSYADAWGNVKDLGPALEKNGKFSLSFV